MGESRRQMEEEPWAQGRTLLPPAEEEGGALFPALMEETGTHGAEEVVLCGVPEEQ